MYQVGINKGIILRCTTYQISKKKKKSTSGWRFYSSYHNDVWNHEPEMGIPVLSITRHHPDYYTQNIQSLRCAACCKIFFGCDIIVKASFFPSLSFDKYFRSIMGISSIADI